MDGRLSEDTDALTVDCPRCKGSGKVLAPPLASLAGAAWLAHKDEAAGFIRAIKTLRGWTGMGLLDAKEAIRSASERLGGVG